jgi:RHS repeat-associated protein
MLVRRISRLGLATAVSIALLAGSQGLSPEAPAAAVAPAALLPPPSDHQVPTPLPAGGVPIRDVVPDRRIDQSAQPAELPPHEKWSDRSRRETAARPASEGFDAATSVEVPAERSRFGTVFKNADGTFTARVEQRPVHFQTAASGKWDKIDPAVRPDPVKPGEFVTRSSSIEARFSTRGVEMTGEKGSKVSWEPRGITLGAPIVAVDGLTVTYADVWPNVDLRFRLFTNEVKEEIVVKGPTSLASFPFDVAGLNVSVDAGGKASANDPEFSIGEVAVFDRDGAPVGKDRAKGANRKLDTTGVSVDVDPVYLSQAAFPIVIDPSFSFWTYLQGQVSVNGTSICTATCYPLQIGSASGGASIYRHTATWDYSNVLPTATSLSTLTNATFTITQIAAGSTSTTQQIAVRHATGYGWCGFNPGNDCNQPLTNTIAVGLVGPGAPAPLDVTSYMNSGFWGIGQPVIGWAFSGDEGGTTYKNLDAALNLTYNRLPKIAQSDMAPANPYLQHSYLGNMQLSVPALPDPDGETMYYRFVVCENPSWASCNVRLDSGFTTSNTVNSFPSNQGGIHASLYNVQLYWGVAFSNSASGQATDWYSPWMNSWKLYNNAAPEPQLIAPVDGFRWAPNAPPTFTISRYADPEGDVVDYRLVVREPGSSGAVWRSDWIDASGLPGQTGALDLAIPATAPLLAGQQYEWTAELRDFPVKYHTYFYNNRAQTAATTFRTMRFEQRLGVTGPSPFQSLGPVTANLATGNVATGVSSVGYEALGGTIGGTFSYNSRAQDNGLRARLFNDSNGDGQPNDALVSQRTDREVRFSWANPSTVPGVNNFVGSWTGFLTPATTGIYKFALAAGADDKAKIEVGSYYVQANQTGAPSEVPLDIVLGETTTVFEARGNVNVSTTAGVTLYAGVPYPVKITYSNPAGPGVLGFYMTAANPGTNSLYSVVPTSLLSPDAPILPAGWTFNHEEGFDAAYANVLAETSQIVVTRSDGEKLTYLKAADGGYTPPPGEDDVVTVTPASGTTPGQVTITDTGGTVYKFRPDGQLDTITSPVDSATPAAAVPAWGDITVAGLSQPITRLTSLTDPVSGRAVTFVYQGIGTCPALAGYVNPATGMLCQVNLPDGSATKLFFQQPATGTFVLSRIEQPGDSTTGIPAIDYGYGLNGLLSMVRDALVNEAIATLPTGAGVDVTSNFTTNLGYDAINRVTSVQAPKAAPGDTARQRVQVAYQGTIGTPTNETWVLVDGLENTSDPNDWDRKVTFDQDARVLLDYQATNATSGQSTRTETRWDTLNDRPLVNITNSQASTSIYNHRGELVTSFGPANQTCFDLTTTSTTYRQPNGTCTNPPVALSDYEYDTTLNANGTSSPFTNLAVSLWPNTTMAAKPNAKTTGLGGTPTTFVYNWGTGGPTGATAADFSFQATGEIRFPTATTYTLEAVAGTDDAVKVYVDDQLILNKVAGPTTASGAYPVAPNAALADGPDQVRRARVEFQDLSGNAALTLNWTPQGGAKVAIPVDRFRPRYSLQTRSTVATNNTTDAPAQVTHTSFDTGGLDPALGMVTQVTEDPTGLNLKTVTGYETGGYRRRISRTLPAGNATTYAYYTGNATVDLPCTAVNDTTVNQGGKLQYTTAPQAADGRAIRTHTIFDALGRTVGVLQGYRSGGVDTWDANWTCTSYDARHRLREVTVPAFGTQSIERKVSTDFKVGNDPRLTSVSDPAGTITTTVDLLGRVINYSDVWGKTSVTNYDQTTGRVTSTSGPAGPQTFTYDRAGRVTVQTLDGVTVATPTYEAPGTANEFALASVAYSNGTSVTNGRNSAGGVNSLTWKQGVSTLATDTVTKVRDGRTIANSFTWSPTSTVYTQSYRYDTVGRLTKATIPGSVIDYNYAGTPGCSSAPTSNLNSNRSSVVRTPTTGTATSQSFCYDGADRLIAPTTGVTNVGYDNRGNTTSVNDDLYGFDGANRHTQTVNNNTGGGGGGSGAVPVHRGTTSLPITAGATSLTLTNPAGTVTGDVLIASIAAADSASTGATTVYSDGFETGPGGWSAWSATSTTAQSADVAGVRTGSKSLKMTPVGAGPSNGRFFPTPAPGVATTITMWAKGTGAPNSYIQYFDAAWAPLGSATTTPVMLSSTAFTSWTATYTPPAGTAIVQVAFSNSNALPWYIDDVTVTTPGGGGATTTQVSTVPANWTPVTTNATTGVKLTTWTHTVAAGDPTTWTFGLSQAVKVAGALSAYSGVDPVSPIDIADIKVNASGLSHTAPSVMPNGVNRIGLSINAVAVATSLTVPPGTTPTSTERADLIGGATGTPNTTLEISEFPQATAVATGAKAAASLLAGASATATVMLKPAAAITGTAPTHRATLSAANTGGNSVTVNQPPGVVVGDVLVAAIASADIAGGSATTIYPNEGFETGLGVWSPWAAPATIATVTTPAPHAGLKSLQMTPSGGQSNVAGYPPFTVGVSNTITAWMKGTGTVQPWYTFYTSTWATISQTQGTPVTLTGASTWQTWSGSYTPPAGTGIVSIAFQNPGLNPWYLDDVTVTTPGGGTPATSVTGVPSGWTPVTAHPVTGGGATLTTLTHNVAAGDPTSWTFGLSQPAKAVGTIGAYIGVDTSNPIDKTATFSNGSVTAHIAPSVDTSGTNRLGITINALTAVTTMTAPTGTTPTSTETADVSATAGAPTVSLETSVFTQTALGATGQKTSSSTPTSATSATATITLRPIPAGGGVTTTVNYVRDSTNRIVERKLNGTTVARYTFSSGGDTPDAELDAAGVVQRRTVGLIGGVVLAKAGVAEIWSISNLHGDTIATLASTGTVTGGPFTYDPFGNAQAGVPDNQIGSFDNGWLGKNQRPLEQQAGLRSVIEMGARIYDPAIGRFLSTDPIEGGTSNDYAYVRNPVDAFDLTGTMCFAFCESWKAVARRVLDKIGQKGGQATRWVTKRTTFNFGGCLVVYCVGGGFQGGTWYRGSSWGLGFGGGVSMGLASRPYPKRQCASVSIGVGPGYASVGIRPEGGGDFKDWEAGVGWSNKSAWGGSFLANRQWSKYCKGG